MISAVTVDPLDSIAERLHPAAVDPELDRQRFMVVKDEALTRLCESAREEYDAVLAQTPVHPPTARLDRRVLAKSPWRKYTIGARTGVGEPYAQLLKSTYFAERDARYPALSALFGLLIKVRNRLMRTRDDFCSDPERDGFWNACRVHHYPRGGGFMSMHQDIYFPVLLGDKPFYQVSALLSRKGRDFHSGGGVVLDRQQGRRNLEDEGGFGSLIIFDGKTYHGVDEIDRDQLLDMSRADGRLGVFVNPYEVLPAP